MLVAVDEGRYLVDLGPHGHQVGLDLLNDLFVAGAALDQSVEFLQLHQIIPLIDGLVFGDVGLLGLQFLEFLQVEFLGHVVLLLFVLMHPVDQHRLVFGSLLVELGDLGHCFLVNLLVFLVLELGVVQGLLLTDQLLQEGCPGD